MVHEMWLSQIEASVRWCVRKYFIEQISAPLYATDLSLLMHKLEALQGMCLPSLPPLISNRLSDRATKLLSRKKETTQNRLNVILSWRSSVIQGVLDDVKGIMEEYIHVLLQYTQLQLSACVTRSVPEKYLRWRDPGDQRVLSRVFWGRP